MRTEPDKRHVDAIGVLSNLEMLERAGFSSARSFWDLAGIDPLSIAPGTEVAWDVYAKYLEEAMARIDPAALERAIREMSSQYRGHFPPWASTREALESSISMNLALWPCLSTSLLATAPPLAAMRLDIPAPLHAFAAYHVNNALALRGLPPAAGLPEPTLIDVAMSPDARTGIYLYALGDEVLGSAGAATGITHADAMGIVSNLTLLERAGVETSAFWSSAGLTATPGRAVPWDAFSSFLDTHASQLDPAHLAAAARALSEQFDDHWPDVGTSRSAVELLANQLGPHLWPCLRFSIVALPAPFVGMRIDIPPPLRASRTYLELSAPALTRLPGRHEARLVWHEIDESHRTGLYVLRLADESVESGRPQPPSHADAMGRTTRPQARPALANQIVDGVHRERVLARTSVIERLGREVASRGDIHSIAELVAKDLREHLDAAAVELRLFVDGTDTPVRIEGMRAGAELVRTLQYDGESLGSLRIWSSPQAAGPILAAVDVLAPWVGVALGTALHRARAAASLADAHAHRRAVESALASVLAAHPHAVFVVDAAGHILAANERAARRLAEEGVRVLERIAEAVGGQTCARFETHPVRDGDRVDRVLVIEQPEGTRSLTERVEIAARRWSLTSRQREVVQLLCKGLGNKEIASELGCSEVTVEKHLTEAFRRAGVNSRALLAAKVWEQT